MTYGSATHYTTAPHKYTTWYSCKMQDGSNHQLKFKEVAAIYQPIDQSSPINGGHIEASVQKTCLTSQLMYRQNPRWRHPLFLFSWNRTHSLTLWTAVTKWHETVKTLAYNTFKTSEMMYSDKNGGIRHLNFEQPLPNGQSSSTFVVLLGRYCEAIYI